MGHFLKMGKIIFLKCLESRVDTGANDGSRTCDLLITNENKPKNHNKAQQLKAINSITYPIKPITIYRELLPAFIINWDKIGTKIYNASHELKRLATRQRQQAFTYHLTMQVKQ
jgi:hypothetical protein